MPSKTELNRQIMSQSESVGLNTIAINDFIVHPTTGEILKIKKITPNLKNASGTYTNFEWLGSNLKDTGTLPIKTTEIRKIKNPKKCPLINRDFLNA